MSYADAKAALSSPVGIGMVLLLLANDHLLKGSGLVPGWLTGKLSDVAGLVIAPLVGVWLVRARARRTQGAVFLIVATLFASVKLSSEAASWLIAAFAWVGVHWRIVVDPTDLLALVAMPLSWWMLQRPRPKGSWPVAALAAAACVASGEPEAEPARWDTEAYVVNDTGAALEVRLRYYDGELDCSAVAPHLGRALDRSAFGQGIQFRLEDMEILPLRYDDVVAAAGLTGAWNQGDESPLEGSESCGLVLLQADGLPDLLVSWNGKTLRSLRVPLRSDDELFEDDNSLAEGRIDLIVNEAGALEAHSRGLLDLLPLVRHVEPSGCSSPALRFQWSVPAAVTQQVIAGTRLLADGCIEVALEADLVLGRDVLLLCIPPASFPFVAGDSIVATETTDTFGKMLEIRDDVGARVLQIYSGASETVMLGGLYLDVLPSSCAGDRIACGGYTSPAQVKIESTGDVLGPGTDKTLVTGEHIFVGRAEHVIAAPTGCEAGRHRIGHFADVVVYTEEATP